MSAISDGLVRAFGIAVIAGVSVEIIKLLVLEPSLGLKARLPDAGWTSYDFQEARLVLPATGAGAPYCYTNSDGRILCWEK